MKCNLGWCSVAIVFLVANLYVTFTADKGKLKDNLYKTLSKEQINQYEEIVRERRDLYLKGYIVGLILAVLFTVFFAGGAAKALGKMGIVCMVGGITLLTNYLYYMLSPKSDYMVLHLDDQRQRVAWLDIYRSMQVKYHVGLALGIGAAMLAAGSVC